MEEMDQFNQLVEHARQHQLYGPLVLQLNKDLALANVNLSFDQEVLPSSLKLMLRETVYQLIQDRFMDYLNLLYIIDVSEAQIKALDGNDILQLSENVSYLILRREWEKVHTRAKYSSGDGDNRF